MQLIDYISPHDEYSLFKGIPMSERHSDTIETLLTTGRYRIRYRGKSTRVYKRHKQHCIKDFATTFAIYTK